MSAHYVVNVSILRVYMYMYVYIYIRIYLLFLYVYIYTDISTILVCIYIHYIHIAHTHTHLCAWNRGCSWNIEWQWQLRRVHFGGQGSKRRKTSKQCSATRLVGLWIWDQTMVFKFGEQVAASLFSLKVFFQNVYKSESVTEVFFNSAACLSPWVWWSHPQLKHMRIWTQIKGTSQEKIIARMFFVLASSGKTCQMFICWDNGCHGYHWIWLDARAKWRWPFCSSSSR